MQQSPRLARIRRSLLSVLVLGSVAVSAMASPLPSSAARMHDALSVGTDLWHMDTATGHYTQAANGLTNLQLYNSPIGIPDQAGWRFRDPRLGAPAADGTVAPADVPVAVHLASRLGGPTFAAMSNEDNAPLGIGLASIAGAAPAAAMGRQSGDMITYPAPIASSPSDLAARATSSGVAVRLVLHSAAERGPFVFSLVLDQIERLAQETGGAIRVTRPMTTYGDDGVPHVIQQAEYVIYAPRVAERNAPAGVGSTGPASLALSSTGGQPVIALSLDQTWLNDAHRAFPVIVDMPIATGYAEVNTGWAGTLNSCAATAPASEGEIAVGVSASCTYHGLLSFDVSTLPYNTPILSAILSLYTPQTTASSNIQVYPNLPLVHGPWQPTSWDQPSWATAPTLVGGTTGIGPSAISGPWQEWNITPLAQQWVRNRATNGGLTLVSAGAPVAFASPFGAMPYDVPATAPILQITYAIAQTPYLPFSDAGSTLTGGGISPHHAGSGAYIYGMAGSFATDGFCSGHACNGAMSVHADSDDQTSGVGGRYMRFGVTLSCQLTVNSATYSSAYSLLSNAYSQGLTPIVQFGPTSCPGGSGQYSGYADGNQWANQVSGFIQYIPTGNPLPWTYYEIGNEPNYNASQYPSWYSTTFGIYAAPAVVNAYSACGAGSSYAVLTGGMLNPSANGTSACYAPGGDENIDDAYVSIQNAELEMNIPASHLGVGGCIPTITTPMNRPTGRTITMSIPPGTLAATTGCIIGMRGPAEILATC